MSNKKFILNADDFGMSNAYNKAVLDGHNNGFLTSASICANGEAFEAAVNEIIPECPSLGIGVHLNIIEGKSLQPFKKTAFLTNSASIFNNGFIKLMYLSQHKQFLDQAEREFRLQIEKVLQHTKVDHIDSHVHVHAIPAIFDLTCKLAKEYEIPQVRTQFENFYLVPSILKHASTKYPPNILKIILLNSFTLRNKKVLQQYNLKSNDYLIGVGYTGMMDDNTLYYGLSSIKNEEDFTAEALIHPCLYDNGQKNQHFTEYKITKNLDLQDKIQRLGYEIVNYKK